MAKKTCFNSKGFKNMTIPKMIVLDILMLAIALGVFFYFDYIKPVKLGDGTVVTQLDESETDTFSLPNTTTDGTQNSTDTKGNSKTIISNNNDDSNSSETSQNKKSSSKFGNRGNTGNTNTTTIDSYTTSSGTFSSSKVTTTKVNSYNNENVQLNITKNETGNGSGKITYYVADVYVSSVSDVLTAFAEKTYGKNIKDDVSDMADENNALLAISGDFYGNSEEGVVIRNGVLYRKDLNDADICVLFKDGTMKTYHPSEFDADQVIAAGAWQAWTFGPELLDGSGNILSSFNSTSYINSNNPRCAIGYVQPGHYKLVVVDGRNSGYSRGVSLSELAEIMATQGCQTAYNLDGGKSAAMYFNGTYVNEPADGGREVSDIIYIK